MSDNRREFLKKGAALAAISVAGVGTSMAEGLQLAWIYETGDMGKNDCQPVVVNGILYGISARMKLFVLDLATGKELWKFDSFATPIMYMKNRKQWVVIAAGGGRLASSTYDLKLGSSIVAFALP